jgi:hypothetical protein
MSYDAGSGQNDPLPYIPAWTENTPPHGHRLPAQPATPGRAAARRAAPPPAKRSGRWRGVLIALIAVLLIGGVAVAGRLYLAEDSGPGIHEGDCLRTDTDPRQDPVECTDPTARFIVIERVTDTTSTAVCDSVTGRTVPLVSDVNGDRAVMCLAARK